MARYDVYVHPDGDGYLLDVQADLLSGLNTCVVVPLMLAKDAPKPADRLNPVFHIEGREVVMATQFMAAVPKSVLSMPVASLMGCDIEITNAIDMVFQGF